EQVSGRLIDMKDDLKVKCVQGGKVFRGLVKRFWIKVERTVADIPSRGAVAGAQVDEGVTGQVLHAKGLGDLGRLLRRGQRAVRLHITQRPLRRHYGLAGQANILFQRVSRFSNVYDEHP